MVEEKDLILKRISNIVWHIETNRWVGDTKTLDEAYNSLKNILNDFKVGDHNI